MDQKHVLVFHGPDFVGKHTLYYRELKRSHKALQPSKLFKENPLLGFRDIGLEIIKALKEGKRMAILDRNECRKTRLSYINLLKKKCAGSSVAVVSVLPKYGCEQLFWTRELRLAAESHGCKNEDSSDTEIQLNDAQIHKWFSSETDCQIQYRRGTVEQPVESEECQVFEKIQGIYTSSNYKYICVQASCNSQKLLIGFEQNLEASLEASLSRKKFEVPVIFVQWEVISGLTSSKQRISNLVKALELWVNTNPCGRIIVVCDGSQIFTGEKTRVQQQRDIDEALDKFASQMTSETPVYAFHLNDPKQAGSYVIPPKPGILAFLQQRHCLNLHSRRSLYLYESSVHMKMAEHAGVRHIKASRVIDHPSLVISSHAASTSTIPEMLKTKKLLPGNSEPPGIPLAGMQHAVNPGRIKQSLPYGRSEYIYAASDQAIERYNDFYLQHATKVGDTGSKMSPIKRLSTTNESSTSKVKPADMTADQSKLSISSRDLPIWMVKKNKSQETRSSVEVSEGSCNEVKTEKKIRKTMYVMTEKELVDVACDILKQAGKEDIVNELMSRNSQDNQNCKKNVEKNSTTSDKYSNKDSGISILGKTNQTDKGESLGSFCPKMEPDSDVEENKVVYGDNAAEQETGSSDNTEKQGGPRTLVHDTVADVLDDFSTSQAEAKPSPRKRNRIEMKLIPSCSSSAKQRRLDTSVSGLDGNLNKTRRDINVQSDAAINRKRTRNVPDLSYLDDLF